MKSSQSLDLTELNIKLSRAASDANLSLVKELIGQGANPNAKDAGTKSAFIYAVNYGNLDVVEFLLKNKADINVTAEYERPALIYAVWDANRKDKINNYLRIAELIIEAGANINQTDEDGKSPVIYAIKNYFLQALELLIKNNADITQKDNKGYTPMSYAIDAYDEDSPVTFKIIELLHRTLNAKTPVVVSKSSRCEQLNILMHYGVSKNKLWPGRSDLMYAIKFNELNTVEELLSKDVDVNTCDLSGSTPLMYAVQNENLALIKKLINKGANINAQNNLGRTALQFAFQLRLSPIVEYFVKEAKADINIKDNFGKNALFYGYDDEIFNFLIESGADVNVISNANSTPLLRAVDYNNIEGIKLILDKMQPEIINTKCDEGHTAVSLAATKVQSARKYGWYEKNYKETLLLLINKGADLEIEGSKSNAFNIIRSTYQEQSSKQANELDNLDNQIIKISALNKWSWPTNKWNSIFSRNLSSSNSSSNETSNSPQSKRYHNP